MHWRELVSGQSRGFGPTVIRLALCFASYPYAIVVRSRNWLYDRGWLRSRSVPIPVISVGNLTVGGTGKTPTVAMLAQWFRKHDIRVAIVSRGYGAGADGQNDEARELEGKLEDVPHLQDPNRFTAASVAYEELATQVLLLDDGFQHRKFVRNLDIVLLDATNPFGYGFLLPRGLLRESPRSLRRADVVMLTRCDQVTSQQLADIRTHVQKIASKVAWIETEHRPVRLRNASGREQPIESLKGRRCFVFSGIGNPVAFLDTVRGCGGELMGSQVFPDHHAYSAVDIHTLTNIIRSNPLIDIVLCTGKDLAKIELNTLGDCELWVVDIELTVRSGMEALEDRLNQIVAMSERVAT